MSAADATSDLHMFVLDVLRYDIEQLPSILKLLNDHSNVGWRAFWPRDFSRREVVVGRGHVRALVESPSGHIEPLSNEPDWRAIDQYWLELADAGRSAWDEWDPPIVSDA